MLGVPLTPLLPARIHGVVSRPELLANGPAYRACALSRCLGILCFQHRPLNWKGGRRMACW
eukprot:10423796-Prorocentrum_lima.AAC.1